MPFEKGLWQTITIVFDNENGAYRIYKDGAPALTGSSVKDGAINTADFSSGWQNGAYSLILGNDGTGEYGQNANQDYEYWIDNFTILDTAVSAEEAVALSDVNIAVEKDLNSITPALIGSETVAAGGGYNTAVHMTGKKLRNISRETFDLVFDPNVLEYNKEVTETQSLNYDQFKNKIVAIDASEAPQGILPCLPQRGTQRRAAAGDQDPPVPSLLHGKGGNTGQHIRHYAEEPEMLCRGRRRTGDYSAGGGCVSGDGIGAAPV